MILANIYATWFLLGNNVIKILGYLKVDTRPPKDGVSPILLFCISVKKKRNL